MRCSENVFLFSIYFVPLCIASTVLSSNELLFWNNLVSKFAQCLVGPPAIADYQGPLPDVLQDDGNQHCLCPLVSRAEGDEDFFGVTVYAAKEPLHYQYY